MCHNHYKCNNKKRDQSKDNAMHQLQDFYLVTNYKRTQLLIFLNNSFILLKFK